MLVIIVDFGRGDRCRCAERGGHDDRCRRSGRAGVCDADHPPELLVHEDAGMLRRHSLRHGRGCRSAAGFEPIDPLVLATRVKKIDG
jgi:hypothetical protein